MIPPLEILLEECERLHGHLCPGQVLGARMAALGCRYIGLDDPKGADRKKLIVWVEIDRCMADAVSAVTGVRLGRRSLKFFDYGKVAATFLNTETGMAVRVVAKDSSRELAEKLHSSVESKKMRQMLTYTEADDSDLFVSGEVRVKYGELDAPGGPRARAFCERCREGVNDGRELRTPQGATLCRPCSEGGYYEATGGGGILL